MYKKKKYTIKIDISKKEFLNELNNDIKKHNLSKLNLKITELILNMIYCLRYFNDFLKRIKFFLLKKLPNKYILLITQDRQKFKNFLICNNFIKKMQKKI